MNDAYFCGSLFVLGLALILPPLARTAMLVSSVVFVSCYFGY